MPEEGGGGAVTLWFELSREGLGGLWAVRPGSESASCGEAAGSTEPTQGLFKGHPWPKAPAVLGSVLAFHGSLKL